jgi:hypothetical protein
MSDKHDPMSIRREDIKTSADLKKAVDHVALSAHATDLRHAIDSACYTAPEVYGAVYGEMLEAVDGIARSLRLLDKGKVCREALEKIQLLGDGEGEKARAIAVDALNAFVVK